MLNQNPTYKKLILRRDMLRIVLNLRMHRQLKKDLVNETVDNVAMNRYIQLHGDLLPKIDKIITATKKGLVNLYAIGEYDDELGEKVVELFDISTQSEKEKIMQIEDEIMYIKHCCPMQNTFVTELMVACYELSLPEEYTNRVSKLLELLPYDSLSSEREYILTRATDITWFKNYLFRSNIPIEEHQKNYDEFILAFIPYPKVREINLLRNVLKLYKKTQIAPSTNTIQTLIDKLSLEHFQALGARDVLQVIRDCHIKIPGSPESYFTSTLKTAQNKDTEYHDLPTLLVDIYDSMINLFNYEDCLKILVKLCASSDVLYTDLSQKLKQKYGNYIIVQTFRKLIDKPTSYQMNPKKDS